MVTARSIMASAPLSLVHPLLMILVCAGWMYALALGLRVRRRRKARNSAEVTLLISESSPRARTHHKTAAGLLFATIFLMSFGMLNTYARTHRLFPGPHLYGAFLLLCLLGLNAALAPWFRDAPKARLVHTAAGGCALLVVLSQVWSGLGILRSLIASF